MVPRPRVSEEMAIGVPHSMRVSVQEDKSQEGASIAPLHETPILRL
ncbi:hypothetical protein [Oscillatoria acuminata]|nr:hypothetical protein [Oscillatoria acuminata]